jgi:hypothetical protein
LCSAPAASGAPCRRTCRRAARCMTTSCVDGPLAGKRNLGVQSAVFARSRVSGLHRGTMTAGPDGCPQTGASSASRVSIPRIRSRLLPARRHGRPLHHARSLASVCFTGRLTSCWHGCDPAVRFSLCHQSPGGPSGFVGESDRDFQPRTPPQQTLCPGILPNLLRSLQR